MNLTPAFATVPSNGTSKNGNGSQTPALRPRSQCGCKTCPGFDSALFASLPPVSLGEIERHKVVNTYLPGQVIFYQDNNPLGVYCVESGRVKIYKDAGTGHRQILRIGVPGEILGYRALLAREPYRATAEALEKTRICFIEKSTFLSNVATQPGMAARLLEKACADLGRAEETLSDLVSKSVEARAAKLLLHLYETCSVSASHGHGKILLQLSRTDIADWIGTTPETAIRILSRFRKRGLVTLVNRDLTIHDPKTLLAISQSCR